MKIYDISQVPEGLRPKTYEDYLISGYTAGYEAGYNSYTCYKNQYFTLEFMEDGNIPGLSSGMCFSINGGEWIEHQSGVLAVSSGDVIRFKKLYTGETYDFQEIIYRCKAYGNTMSLIYGDDFADKTEFPSGALYCLRQKFAGSDGLIDASDMVLPATTLVYGCYMEMFENCINLVSAPKLPATDLANECYMEMFRNCRSLETAPELPATILQSACYMNMFEGCSSLVTAPALSSTTLASMCYSGMFAGCTSLRNAPELPATNLPMACYQAMFNGCSNLVTAPELPATTLGLSCYQVMFANCTALSTAPNLPATLLADSCYYGMFSGCTNMTAIPDLPATTLRPVCYSFMFENCRNFHNAPVLPAATLADWCYYRMFSGCIAVSYVKCLATDISAKSCTNYWLDGVEASGTFVKNADMEAWGTGSSGIPDNWTVINA